MSAVPSNPDLETDQKRTPAIEQCSMRLLIDAAAGAAGAFLVLAAVGVVGRRGGLR